MAARINATDSNSQQWRFWTARQLSIGVTAMNQHKEKQAKPTEADLVAASNLRTLWDAAVAESIRDPNRKRITQEDVAEVLGGVSQSAISQYLNGLIPLNYAALHAFAKVIGCSPSDIRQDLREQRIAEEPASYGPPSEWTDIRASTQGAALGDGADLDEYAETHRLKFRADSLQRKRLRAHKLEVFYGQGDSMEGRVRNGDALLVNLEETTPIHDKIFMVRWQGQYYAKRLKKLGSHWFLCSDNLSDPKWRDPVAIEDHHDFEVIGRVRWIGSWED